MDTLLLEKAEIQQNLSMCRKDLEKTKQQGKVRVLAYQFITKVISYNCLILFMDS